MKGAGLAHPKKLLEECIGALLLSGGFILIGIKPLLRLLEQRQREKVKADGVCCHTIDSEGATHLQEVLMVGISILMRLPAKWFGLHHVDKHRFKLKSGIPKLNWGPMATSAADGAKKAAINF
jgi:hypothetical protein